MQVLRDWFRRYFSDPQVVILALFLVLGFVGMAFFGKMLAPALTAVVLAYLMEGLVAKLQRLRIPRGVAVATVFLCFVVSVTLVLLVLVPRLMQQIQKFIADIPNNAVVLQEKVSELRETHPHLFISAEDQQARDERLEFLELARQAEAARAAEAARFASEQQRPPVQPGPALLVMSDEALQELAQRLSPIVLNELQKSSPFLLTTNRTTLVPPVEQPAGFPTLPFPSLPEVPKDFEPPDEQPEPDDTAEDKQATDDETEPALKEPEADEPEELAEEEEERPKLFTGLISERFVEDLVAQLGQRLTGFGGDILAYSLKAGTLLVVALIYLILVPLLVLFFLKDKQRILDWFRAYLPQDRALVAAVWRDVDGQIGNYIRGKFLEILIVWAVSYITFMVFDLDYAMLLALFVGLSVLVPYIGATVMTVPIALVAFFQFGTTGTFWWVLGAYGIIQLLDGNVLAPLLLSEVTNLHPVAIIVAVLIFGGLWGFWGVFFAIPLATLVQAVLRAWPNKERRSALTTETERELEPDPA